MSTVANYVREVPAPEREAGIRVVRRRNNQAMEPTMAVRDGEMLRIELISPARHETFCRTAAEALPQVLRQLLAGDAPLGMLGLCPGRREELRALSGGEIRPFAVQTLQALMEDSLRRHASLGAMDGVEQVTYAALDAASRCLGGLTGFERAAKGLVAVVLPAGVLCAATVVAVVRSGGSFLCLNPEGPPAELLEILAVAGPELVVTSAEREPLLRDPRWRVLPVSDADLQGEGRAIFGAVATPEDLAYLVHTSGSTGRPKVIRIEQHSAANLVAAMLAVYGLRPGDRRLHRSQPGPDFFVAELLIPLLGGATLVRPGSAELATMTGTADFLELLDRHRITVASLPSSYWRELVAGLGGARLPSSLRLMIVGMETVDPETLRAWEEAVPPEVELLNAYGPSETTMIATVCPLRGWKGEGLVPIGRPLPNTSVQVLDRALQWLPPGTVGEICIAGAGVMRGYAGGGPQEGLVANPHDARPGFSRLYRTGDFGYHDAEGNLVFVGRRDGQVKIRGHRVELGTVERHLGTVAGGVAVVAMVLRRGGRNVLVGVVESTDGPPARELRQRLRESVREAFIPGTVLFLDPFPRLPNGKLDRRGLREWAEAQLAGVKPGSEDVGGSRLAKMVAIWNALFEGDDCTEDSNFFELGGDSLLAVRLSLRVEEAMGQRLPLNFLYSTPTIGGLVRQLEAAEEAPSSLVRLAAGPAAPAIVCVHGWGGQILSWRTFAGHFEGERDCWGVLAAEHAGGARARSLREMGEGYAAEIR